MRQEYRYLLIVAVWIFLWSFVPTIALCAFVFFVVKHFVQLRRERRRQRVAEEYHRHDARWAELEGFGAGVEQVDPADWWKKQ